MKRFLALLMMAVLLIGLIPQSAFAAAKQMEDNVPVWTEETVRQYALDYVAGKSMERLYGYYDLQIRRYMPNETYESLLVDLYWMTGGFLGLGSYRSFAEPERQLKTHVLHLCMEKQDLDLYFTHKDKENDWEIMAIEFVPAAEEEVLNMSEDMFVVSETESLNYIEEAVTVGAAPYLLEGILTLPASASAGNPVPVCLLIHDEGAYDRDLTIGQTALFKDIAITLAEREIATLRYDKCTYTYPEAEIETVADEAIIDALSAVELLNDHPMVDSSCIVVLGMGFGAHMVPRIVKESEVDIAGMILVGAPGTNYLQFVYDQNKASVSAMSKNEADTIKSAVRNMGSMKEEKARELTLFGKNGYYYWEMLRTDFVKTIKNLRKPVYFIQGRNDPIINEDDGVKQLNQLVGTYKPLYAYKSFRGLNRILMDDRTVNANGEPEYAIEAHLDQYAGLKIGEWISNLNNN
ncbi:MAG: hypothetical protein J6K55_07820 [Clostridia bacterium]|nr:hypothetical protein [Clostridia bacterium]